jgi:hypothetical protein
MIGLQVQSTIEPRAVPIRHPMNQPTTGDWAASPQNRAEGTATPAPTTIERRVTARGTKAMGRVLLGEA